MTTAPVDADTLFLELVGTPEGRTDPYPRYASLRAQAPVHRSTLGLWVLSRYDDCEQLLRSPGVGKKFSGAQQAQYRDDQTNMLFADPPDHTRLRGLATRAFTPRTVEALRPHIVAVVEQLIDAMGDGEVDVMDALAVQLPLTVIGEMLGVPAEDRPQLGHLVRQALVDLVMTSDVLAAATAATVALEEFFIALISERRARPQNDLLSDLIEAEEKGDQLTDRELISTAMLLAAAALETTTNLIGNGLLALLRHPDQLARLRADRGLLRPAVGELLRYDGSVQMTSRTAYEDLEIGGHEVEAGSTVLVLLGAANRDPSRFTDPDRLDVGRAEGSPLSFGSGIHFCLGAALARSEAEVVLERLLGRFRSMELVGGEPERRDSLTLRGLVDLRVRFTC